MSHGVVALRVRTGHIIGRFGGPIGAPSVSARGPVGPKGPEQDMSRMLSGHQDTVKVTKPPTLTGTWMAAAATTFTAWNGPWGLA
jgi:hypothetical protein